MQSGVNREFNDIVPLYLSSLYIVLTLTLIYMFFLVAI